MESSSQQPQPEPLLVTRKQAAFLLSISTRSLDFAIGTQQINIRKVGTRVLIPMSEVRRFARADHPSRRSVKSN
jgi:hypothetical protein